MTTRASLLRLGLLLAFAAIIALALLHRAVLDPASLQHQIQATGPWAPIAFIALFAMGTVVFLPGAVFGLTGGALFGPAWGTVWNLIGATLGATLAFLATRYIAGGWVRRRTGGRLQELIQGVEAEGWRFVAFVRLVPLFPFNLLNYALGLTRIRLDHYILASLLAMIPGTIAYTWLGYAGREAAGGSDTAVRHLLAALGLVAAVAFLPRLIRRLRRKDAGWVDAGGLTRQLEQDRGPLVIDVRGAEEFNGPLGHIPAAQNIPLGDLPGKMATLVASKSRRLILVCRTDRRSAKAAELLKEAGFADVGVLSGGMEEWNRQALEVARDVGG